MEKMDFSKYKFRCSSLGKLMKKSKTKKDILAKTTKSYLMEIYIEAQFDRKRDIYSKYLDKGNYAEDTSITLIGKLERKLYMKNTKEFENDWITGTPDISVDKEVIDVKTSWDMLSFMKADGSNKDYYWQLQGYKFLTEKKKSRLIYALVNSPEHLIVSEKSKQMYMLGLDEGSKELIEMEERVDKNMTFDDVDESLRVKPFAFEYNEEDIDELKKQIEASRGYLNTLSL